MINKLWLAAATLAVVLTAVCSDHATPSEQCPGKSIDDLRSKIQVKPCGKTRCNLPRNTNITVTFKFTPKKVVKTLVNEVNADIAGVTLPFFGVDGTNACNDVKRVDTDEYTSCPLAAGYEYMYVNVFPILPLYPTLKTRVHWSLNDGKESLICFEVPAAITGGSKKN